MSLSIKKPGIPAIIWCAGLTAVIGMIAANVPLFNILAYMIWLIPAIIFIRQEGLKKGLVALTIAGILMIIGLQSFKEGLFYIIQFLPASIIVGLLLKNHVSTNRSLFIIIGTATGIGGFLLGYSWLAGFLDITELRRHLLSTIDPYMEILKQTNALEVQQARGYTEAMVREMLKETVELSIQLIPASTILGVLVSVVFNYFLAGKILTRINSYQTPLNPFSQWQLPWYIIWLMIAGLALYLAGPAESIWAIIGKNLILVDVVISIIIGLAVTVYYFARLSFGWFFKIILIFILVLNLPVTLIMLLIIGLFDPAVNFRRLGINKETE
ncbi:MAG: DUF2232 domain-containing protein [Clostridia bacterium]|nr:DUF2232 domain-containing protein [Clostridia bacterium]